MTRRSEVIQFRVSLEERAKIAAAALRAGVPMSVWIRMQALRGSAPSDGVLEKALEAGPPTAGRDASTVPSPAPPRTSESKAVAEARKALDETPFSDAVEKMEPQERESKVEPPPRSLAYVCKTLSCPWPGSTNPDEWCPVHGRPTMKRSS